MLLEHNDAWAVQRARSMVPETMAPLSVRQVFDPPDQIPIFLTPRISLPAPEITPISNAPYTTPRDTITKNLPNPADVSLPIL